MAGVAYDLLMSDKTAVLVEGNDFAINCILYDNEGNSDELKGVPSFIGLQIIAEDQAKINDSAEIALDHQDITIGVPKRGWKISVENTNDGQMYDFAIKDVLDDKTTGLYRIMLETRSQRQPTENQVFVKRNFGGR
jgi:hypothetical protein